MSSKEGTTTAAYKPPLASWLGGKSKLAKTIIERIPEHTCYCEPFCGAAWVLFSKQPSKVEVINDINQEVINLYRCMQWHPEELLRFCRWVLPSRHEFERLKKADPSTLTDIQRAARFYYVQQSCFGGRITGPTWGYSWQRPPKFNLLRLEEHLASVHLRLSKAYIECLPYSDVIARYDSAKTFFYIDPPYWGCEKYYGKDFFGRDDFALLANQLAGIQGKFILSLNDVPDVRKIFAAFAIHSVKTTYTCGKGKNLPTQELLIQNFE